MSDIWHRNHFVFSHTQPKETSVVNFMRHVHQMVQTLGLLSAITHILQREPVIIHCVYQLEAVRGVHLNDHMDMVP